MGKSHNQEETKLWEDAEGSHARILEVVEDRKIDARERNEKQRKLDSFETRWSPRINLEGSLPPLSCLTSYIFSVAMAFCVSSV